MYLILICSAIGWQLSEAHQSVILFKTAALVHAAYNFL